MENAIELLKTCGFDGAFGEKDSLSEGDFRQIASQVDDIHMSKMLLIGYEKIDAKKNGFITEKDLLSFLQ